jgi:acyltransferase
MAATEANMGVGQALGGSGRVHGIDFFKGVLILLVIVGHIMTYSQYLVKHLIYGFHMPLFLAVSGYMVRQDTLRQTALRTLLGRYSKRMLLPWLLAFATFFFMEHRDDLLAGDMGGAVLAESILYPAFHLWYVPVLFLVICGLWLCEYWRLPITALWSVAILFTIGWMASVTDPIHGPRVLYYVGDKRLMAFFSFFLMGYGLRHNFVPMPTKRLGVIVLIFFTCLHIAAYYGDWGSWERLIVVGLNLSVIGVFVPIFTSAQALRLKPFNWIGQQSLGIYLWHPFFIFAAHKFLYKPEMPMPFFVLSAALIGLILLPGVRLAMAIVPLDRIVLGNWPNPSRRA